jgi:hypothetical protein
MLSRVSHGHVRAAAVLTCISSVAFLAASATQPAVAAKSSFSNTPLYAHWDPTAFIGGTPPSTLSTSPLARDAGHSEPAIWFGPDGEMAVDGLAWLPYQVDMWKGTFRSTPTLFGHMDAHLPQRGARLALGDGDADVDITAAGTTLLADLDFFLNPTLNAEQLGVSVTRCPAGSAGPGDCTTKILDTAQADREWLASAGSNVWLAYHDSASSTLIHVLRSTNDGRTWSQAGSPIPGQGAITGTCTFNNEIGPIAADQRSGDVYAIFVCGDTVTKGRAFTGNNVVVSRSTDGGMHWHSTVALHEPRSVQLANIFPSMAVDPVTGDIWATASTIDGILVMASSDHGKTWSRPVNVSTVTSAVMPWVAARDGKVDVVYYGTSASSIDDKSAVWNVYDSQWTGGAWHVMKVSNTPNRVGAVCLNGAGCTGDRELLDLFEIAEDPGTGKAAIVYTDSTLSTYTSSSGTHELPEIVLAYEQ